MLTRLDPRRQSFTRPCLGGITTRLLAVGRRAHVFKTRAGTWSNSRHGTKAPLVSALDLNGSGRLRDVERNFDATNCKVGATGNVDMRQCPGSLGQNAFTKSSYENAMGYWLPNQFVSLVSQSKERSVKAYRGGGRRVNCCPGYLCWKMKHCNCPCQGVSISSESFQLLRMSSTAQD